MIVTFHIQHFRRCLKIDLLPSASELHYALYSSRAPHQLGEVTCTLAWRPGKKYLCCGSCVQRLSAWASQISRDVRGCQWADLISIRSHSVELQPENDR